MGRSYVALIFAWHTINFLGCAHAQNYSYVTLDHPSATRQTFAQGINNSGQVVGYHDNERGFIFNNGTWSDIHYPSASQTYAYGINRTGQIVGYYTGVGGSQGFLYSDGVFATFGAPRAPNNTNARVASM